MSTVTSFLLDRRSPREPTQRFGIALGLSVIAHIILIAMFAELLKPLFKPLAGHVGQALPIEVALVGVRPIPFAAPPEVPEVAAEVSTGPTPAAVEAVSPVPPPPASPPRASVAAANPFGVSVLSDVNAANISADLAPPPGNTSVGPIVDSERLGHAQALRLAQRFPQVAAKQAQLREPLIVPYPPDAARAHAEARIGVLLVLDAAGNVMETTLFPDEPQFGPAVRGALKAAHFVPAEADGKPIAYWVLLEFVFKLGHPSVTRRVPA